MTLQILCETDEFKPCSLNYEQMKKSHAV